ncbi:MAG TPA: hypothetical protein VJ123_10810 [Anaerolineales bacterium]|nr:hypothetical protein [Anaerolineales bacterium]
MSLVAIGALLAGCVTLATPPTPPPTPVPPSGTPTFTFPTLPPTFTATGAPSLLTPTPDLPSLLAGIIYRDDFDENQGWDLNDSKIGGISLFQGRLALAVRRSGATLFAVAPSPELEGFFVEVETRAELCADADEFGLMVRMNPQGDHYRFTLNCIGQARFARVQQGVAFNLLPPTETHAAISGAPAENRLGLLADGRDLRLFINGLEVFFVRDAALPRGGLGLIARSAAGGQLTVSFDHLAVYGLLATPTPTLTPTA